MSYGGKCDEDLKVHVPTALKVALQIRANKKKRGRGEVSDYVRHVLIRHLIVEEALEKAEGAQDEK